MQLVETPNKATINWDPKLLGRSDMAGPRYTSYPTALQFHEEFGEADFQAACQRSNANNKPLSLYFHIPFCDTICYYCACNKIVTANKSRGRGYLDLITEEIHNRAQLFDDNRPIVQLHWGGGTPTFISDAEMTELMHTTARHFNLLEGDRGEYSIEIDPRSVTPERIGLIRGLGFNRISLGVQDFNLDVQKAVNRVQPYDKVRSITDAARSYGFHSISMDLIYGLPLQTLETFKDTIANIVTLSPDRISLFNYAHLPARFKTQRQIREEDLPSSDTKLKILSYAANALQDAGYVYIGMDHFAKADDDLTKAQQDGSLRRNFQGYSTRRDADLIGFGVSAISEIDNTYSQNVKTVAEYEDQLRAHQSPIERGYTLTDDDQIRRAVIMSILCNNEINKAQLGRKLNIDFDRYFSDELAELQALEAENLLVSSKNVLELTGVGRLLVRRICLVFDVYNRDSSNKNRSFSRIL